MLIDSHYKGRNFRPDSVLAGLFSLSLALLPFFCKNTGKRRRGGREARPLFCRSEHRGPRGFVLSSYACSRGPSPCSRPCICTCMSPVCCSRWQSCCSGSVLKSTHPRLKENGNMATFQRWGMKSSRHNSAIAKGKCFLK